MFAGLVMMLLGVALLIWVFGGFNNLKTLIKSPTTGG